MGTTCGRREWEAGQDSEKERSFHAPEPRRWKAPRSSERRRPSREAVGTWASAGRYRAEQSSSCCVRTGWRQRVFFGRQGGERRRRAPGARNHAVGDKPPVAFGDTSFAWSKGPCTLIVTTLRRSKAVEGGAVGVASRSGKPTQVGRTGTEVASVERSAARRASPLPQGRPRDA